jgi:hypothetical protein
VNDQVDSPIGSGDPVIMPNKQSSSALSPVCVCGTVRRKKGVALTERSNP